MLWWGDPCMIFPVVCKVWCAFSEMMLEWSPQDVGKAYAPLMMTSLWVPLQDMTTEVSSGKKRK